jgi:hypothetical protein
MPVNSNYQEIFEKLMNKYNHKFFSFAMRKKYSVEVNGREEKEGP